MRLIGYITGRLRQRCPLIVNTARTCHCKTWNFISSTHSGENKTTRYEQGIAKYSTYTTFKCWNCGHKYSDFSFFCPGCNILQEPSKRLTFFDLFDLETVYEIKKDALSEKFRKIQSHLHPDKFSNKTVTEHILSEEYSSLINKAYSTLINPLKRAIYMLELIDVYVEEEEISMDQSFLMEIMELNEDIDGASSTSKLEELEKQNQARLTAFYKALSAAFDSNDVKQAKILVMKLKYFVSLENRIKDLKMKAIDR